MLTRSCARLGWLLLGVGLFMCSCSKEPAESFAGGDPTSPIVPEAEARMTVESRADLSGVVSGTAFPAGTAKVFSVVGYSGTAVPTAWSSPYIPNVAVNSGAGSALSFATPQYYPANGNKVYFYAYSPVSGTYTAGSGSTAPKVKWTITGGQDIMWAKVDNGIAKAVTGSQRQPAFAFTHLLKQVKFKVVKDASFEDNIKLTSLKIVGAKTKASLALNTGTLSWETATGELIAYNNTSGQAITSTATSAGSAVMMEPGASFKVRAVAGGVTYADVTVTLGGTNAGGAGKSHEVTLTFKRSSIAPSAQITDWTDGGETASGESSMYPYVQEGKIVVLRDEVGSADPDSYSFHQPWTTTPVHRESSWNSENCPDNKSGYNTVGERFEVASADVGEMSWTDAQTACASYRENGMEGWRLPTMKEWFAIYRLKGNLTAANLPSTSIFWAATEFNDQNGWSMEIKQGWSFTDGKKENIKQVRCVRDITLKKYPYVVEGSTIVLKDQAGFADPYEFVTHSAWVETPAHSEPAWTGSHAYSESGYNTAGQRFRVAMSDACSKDAGAAMNWYEAAGVRDQTHNPTRYSACASYCEQDDQSDKGLWRAPTVSELKLIYSLSAELTAVASPLSANNYMSATGSVFVSTDAWVVNFADGDVVSHSKSDDCYLRCVRDEGVRDTRGWPYVLDGRTLVVQDEFGKATSWPSATHGPWAVTPRHAESYYNSNSSGCNLVGKQFFVAARDLAKEKGYKLLGEVHETHNPDGSSSACGDYYEENDKSDQGLWRVPTIHELILMIRWNHLWATPLTSNYYWSFTAKAGRTECYIMRGSNKESVYAGSWSDAYSVRCIRDVGATKE